MLVCRNNHGGLQPFPYRSLWGISHLNPSFEQFSSKFIGTGVVFVFLGFDAGIEKGFFFGGKGVEGFFFDETKHLFEGKNKLKHFFRVGHSGIWLVFIEAAYHFKELSHGLCNIEVVVHRFFKGVFLGEEELMKGFIGLSWLLDLLEGKQEIVDSLE